MKIEPSVSAAAWDAPGFWRAASAVIRDGLVFVDSAGVALEVNPALCLITGLERDELVGRRWPYAYWPTELSALPLEARDLEQTFCRPNGERRCVSVDIAPLPGQPGRLITVRDISEDKRLQQALRASEQRWRSVAENPYDYVVIVDRSYHYIYINHAPGDMVIQDLIGKRTPFESADPRYHEVIRNALETTFRDGTPSSYEAYSPVRGKWFSTVVGAIFENDQVVALSLLSRDITTAKRAELAAAQLEAHSRHLRRLETLGTLAGGIAHDFNNLLVPILSCSELLLERPSVAAEPVTFELVNGIANAALRAREVVRRILLFARGSDEPPALVDLGEIARDVVALLRTTAPRNASVELQIAPGALQIAGVAGQIHQALVNLITNAYQAIGDQPGRVTLVVERVDPEPAFAALHGLAPGPAISVRVEDDGPGMPASVVERIFEPFYTTKAVGEGTGLGLSVVHSVVTKHRGAVVVDSRVGHGARFSLYFPAAAAAQPAASEAAAEVRPAAAAGKSLRILCAEDDAMILRVMCHILEQAGHVVSTARAGDEALEAVRGQPAAFDLVVSDQNMPELRGSELAQRLLAVRGDLPVILLSGNAARLQRSPNVRACLQKPFQMDALLEVVQRVARGET